jgi:hypothetical protein
MWTRIDQLALDILENKSIPAELRGSAAEASKARFEYCQMLVTSQVNVLAAEPGAVCSSDSGYDAVTVSTAFRMLDTDIPAPTRESAGNYLLALLQVRRDFLAALML